MEILAFCIACALGVGFFAGTAGRTRTLQSYNVKKDIAYEAGYADRVGGKISRLPHLVGPTADKFYRDNYLDGWRAAGRDLKS